MFHVNLSSKRAKLALRFFTYGVMTLATILLSFGAIFYAMGYRFNQNDLSFEQGGLIQFRSVPQGAHILIDGAQQSFTTPGRMNVISGSHTVEMQLNSYNSWKKTVSVSPGQLLWLNYARLVPTDIVTSPVSGLDAITNALMSPNHKWVFVNTQGGAFKIYDLNDPKKIASTDLVIPDEAIAKQDGELGQFVIKEWDLGSRYILVEHISKNIHEFLKVDRENAANIINVSRVFSLNISDAHFAGSNPNILYVNTDGAVRSLDVNAGNASAALVSGVEQFTVYGNSTLAFVSLRDSSDGDASKQRVVGLYTNSKETVVRTYSAETPVLIDYSEYAHHAYLAINTGDGVAKILRDPTETTQDNAEVGQLKLDDSTIKWLKFSGNGQILAAGKGNKIATYDLELDKLNSWTIGGAEITRPLLWLDDYYLWSDAGGKLRMFEFDGNNDHEITSVSESLAVGLSADGAYLYSFGQAKDAKIPLQSSRLILE